MKFAAAMRAYKAFPEHLILDNTNIQEFQGKLIAVNKGYPPMMWNEDKGKWQNITGVDKGVPVANHKG